MRNVSLKNLTNRYPINCNHSNQSITRKPSLSSKGFDNTFRLLERRLRKNIIKTHLIIKKYANKASGYKFNYSNYWEEQCDTQMCYTLDLELEVIERLTVLCKRDIYVIECMGQLSQVDEEENSIQVFLSRISPALSLLYNFVMRKSHDSRNLMDCETEMILETLTIKSYNNTSGSINIRLIVRESNVFILLDEKPALKYYAGRDANGNKCLRVLSTNVKHIRRKGKDNR